MRRTALLLSICAATLALAIVVPAGAQAPTQLNIKVGTLAPEGTPWYDVIQEVGANWKKASGGTISLTIFGGGVQGDEPAMVSKMRIGQLQMGAFTSVGLETITKEMSALWIPLLFRNYDELDYVRGKIDARLEKALGDKGFVVLNWGDAGWVKYFAKKPIPNLKALQELKLFTWAGNSESEEMYKDAGFKIVPLAATDILMNLQRNMIEAFPAPATAALANQWFGLAKNMMDIKFAPIVGATIITKAAWDKIDPSLRPTLLKLARETGTKFTPKIRGLETEAIDAMVKRGLQIQKLTPQAEQEWQQTAEKFYPKIRGTIVPADLFDEVKRLVMEYRAQKKPEPAKKLEPAKTLEPVKK
ncbi:MAG: TRAP transporter substrate-binding protein DctP [Acidobacteria bacterium]|nr:TRAP transporter substrate-binding protein DctP [Acidobacteriota bacterium]